MKRPSVNWILSGSSLRIVLLQGLVVLVFAGFGFRLWRLQVSAGEQYRELATRNRTRLIKTDASRGIIYDRTNELLGAICPVLTSS